MFESFKPADKPESSPSNNGIDGLLERFRDIRENRIDPADFKGLKLLSDEEIARDLHYVEKVENDLKLKRNRLTEPEKQRLSDSEILETMFPLVIKDFDWLGPNIDIIHTSRYDDLVFGIDSAVEFIGKDDMGLEIDFTGTEAKLKEKVVEMGRKISMGIKPEVKYFDSERGGKRVHVTMPKIAFGAPLEEINALSKTLANAYVGKNPEAAKAELRNHKLKHRFVETTAAQLEYFGEMARKRGDRDYYLIHRRLLDLFKERGLIK